MIIKFKEYNEGLLSNVKDLTYEEALELTKLGDDIIEYFTTKYPTYDRFKVFGKYGREINKTSLKRVMKIAKDHKDQFLINLINDHLATIARFVNDPEMYRKSKDFDL